MGLITIERGDTILTKDGATIRVMAVYYNGDMLSKIEGIDDNEPSPMRRPVWNNNILRVVKKAEKKEEVKKAGA